MVLEKDHELPFDADRAGIAIRVVIAAASILF